MDTPKFLAGKAALVTGASRGVGKGIALELAHAGCRVAVNFLDDEAEGAAAAAEVAALGVDAVAVRGDVRRAGEVAAMVATAVRRFGRLDVFVNNAGVQTWTPLVDLSEADWDLVIDTNLKGCFLGMQAAARQMITQRSGAIVNIGSGSNKIPFPNLSSYTASKGGIEMLTKVAALELGALGIRVNCVAPGAVEVERTRLELPDYAGQWGRATPLGRVGQPEDIGRVVAWVASDFASFVTGQTIWVDGGLFSQPPWPR